VVGVVDTPKEIERKETHKEHDWIDTAGEENILTRNVVLIKDLCSSHDNYKFCVSAFEKIGRLESWHFKSEYQQDTKNYWNIHCTPKRTNDGNNCKRIGSERVRIYKTEEESIKDFYNTILDDVYKDCNNFWCMHLTGYATDPNWNNVVSGVKMKSLIF